MKLIPTTAIAAGFALASCNAQAPSTSWRTELETNGLAAAEAAISAGPQSPETEFVRGALQSLQAIEAVMQVAYRNTTEPLPIFPGMGIDVPVHEHAAFDPAFLENAMTGALSHLSRAEATLGSVAGEEFAVEIDLSSLWFDINDNGTREDFEHGRAYLDDFADDEPDGETASDMIVRFDTADAYWLKAYVHALSGTAELILSVDPTPAIETVYEGRKMMQAAGSPSRLFIEDEQLDALVATILALRGVPDAERTRAAHDHFRAMIAENQNFWTAVMAETDDDHEWVPNPDQVSAFGVPVSAEMAEQWQTVLTEVEDILEGRTLLPTWRFDNGFDAEEGVGLNIAKFLEEPGDLDIILLIHGAGLAPYLETGPLARGEAWRQFSRMSGTNDMLFAFWLN
ncbi:MAG: hypothetical protein WA989_13665 [Henriciella sp.]|uniref:hypothetical protein n=1 Tax=Henriciella sp. TaxID=1968823 RepID=UPI003C76C775